MSVIDPSQIQTAEHILEMLEQCIKTGWYNVPPGHLRQLHLKAMPIRDHIISKERLFGTSHTTLAERTLVILSESFKERDDWKSIDRKRFDAAKSQAVKDLGISPEQKPAAPIKSGNPKRFDTAAHPPKPNAQKPSFGTFLDMIPDNSPAIQAALELVAKEGIKGMLSDLVKLKKDMGAMTDPQYGLEAIEISEAGEKVLKTWYAAFYDGVSDDENGETHFLAPIIERRLEALRAAAQAVVQQAAANSAVGGHDHQDCRP